MQPVAPLLVNLAEHPAQRAAMGVTRLSHEAAIELGLQDGQVIEATLNQEKTALLIAGKDGRFLQLPFNGSPYQWASGWFRVEFSPYGVYLKPHAAPALPVTPPATAARPVEAASLDQASFLRGLSWMLSLDGARAWTPFWQRLVTAMATEPTLQQLASQVLLRSDALAPLQVYQALRSSGLFRASAAAETTDLPKLLAMLVLRKGQDVTSGGADALDELFNSTLARLDAAQHEAALARANGEWCFRFPLLFEDRPPSEVVLRRTRREDGAAGGWRAEVEISTDSGECLALSCVLSGTHSIAVAAWVREPAMAEQMREWIPALRERLGDFGLGLDSCIIHDGPRPGSATDGQRGSMTEPRA
ncbi:MAG: hypothetical protein ACO3PV_07680 [Pseudohongiellaceae bacterium]